MSMSGCAPAFEVSIVMVGALLRPEAGIGDSRPELASESAIIVLFEQLTSPCL